MITFYILHGHHYLGFGRSKSQHSMLIIGPMQRISRQHIFHISVFFSVIYSLTQMFSDPSPLLTDEIILARSKGFNLQTMIHPDDRVMLSPWGGRVLQIHICSTNLNFSRESKSHRAAYFLISLGWKTGNLYKIPTFVHE